MKIDKENCGQCQSLGKPCSEHKEMSIDELNAEREALFKYPYLYLLSKKKRERRKEIDEELHKLGGGRTSEDKYIKKLEKNNKRIQEYIDKLTTEEE